MFEIHIYAEGTFQGFQETSTEIFISVAAYLFANTKSVYHSTLAITMVVY